MREIKFRYRVQDRKTKQIIIFCLSIDQVESTPTGFTENFFNWMKFDLLSRDEYTGLKDKNGNESFESDYIKSEFGIEGIIIFDLGAFSVDIKKIGEKSMYDIASKPCLFDMGDFEIIGNQWGNPELLKGN